MAPSWRSPRTVCLVLAAGWALAALPAPAQDIGATGVAVVDLQDLQRRSLAGRSIEAQMSERRALFTAEVEELERALRREEQELQQQAALLAPEAFQERRRQFEQKVIELQRDVRERQAALERTYVAAMDELRGAITRVLQDFLEQRGIEVVLPRTVILVAQGRLDLTEEALAALDRLLPDVTLVPVDGR